MSNDLRSLPKLKPAIKKRWLKALRSGEYKQGKGQLRTLDGYCCLGVLADVVKGDKALQLEWSQWGDLSEEGGMLPDDIFAHVVAPGTTADPDDAFDPLIKRNDGGEMKPQTFVQIAKLIEAHC